MLCENFVKEFGPEVLDTTLACTGRHSRAIGSLAIGKEALWHNDDEKLAFALLEILDFECNKYGDYGLISDRDIRIFLWRNRDLVKRLEIPPPSYIGAVIGCFSFLLGEEEPE